MVDRLTHKAHLVNMSGQSYRVKETQNMRRYVSTKIKELYPLHNETSGLLFNYYLVYFSIIIYTCYRVESSDYRGFGCTVSICLVAGRSRTRRRNR